MFEKLSTLGEADTWKCMNWIGLVVIRINIAFR
jgi:hypothetical protein